MLQKLVIPQFLKPEIELVIFPVFLDVALCTKPRRSALHLLLPLVPAWAEWGGGLEGSPQELLRDHTDYTGRLHKLLSDEIPVYLPKLASVWARRPLTFSLRNMPSSNCWAICSPFTPHLQGDEVNKVAEEPRGQALTSDILTGTQAFFGWLTTIFGGSGWESLNQRKGHWRKA